MSRCDCPMEAHNNTCPQHPDAARFEKIRDMAREEYAVDGIDIDADAKVSEGDDNGAYVQAWVWVSFEGTEFAEEERESIYGTESEHITGEVYDECREKGPRAAGRPGFMKGRKGGAR